MRGVTIAPNDDSTPPQGPAEATSPDPHQADELLVDKIDALQVLRADTPEEKDRMLEAIAGTGKPEQDIVRELSKLRPLWRPDRFEEAHRWAMRSLEVLDRFGAQVLSERMAAGWDVGVIMLGNNYDLDQASYLKQMTALVDRFDTRPVVLLTVSEFESSRAKVNDAIRSIAVSHSNVLVAEWADVTRDAPQLLGGDRLHLTNDGRAALAQLVAATLSTAPAQPGKCLSTNYEDDSAGSVNGDPDSSSTTTTKKQSSATSVPRTTVPRSTIPRTTIPKATTTSPSTTDPSTTDPSTTDPPGTGAP